MAFHDTQNAKTGVPVLCSGIGGDGSGTRCCGALVAVLAVMAFSVELERSFEAELCSGSCLTLLQKHVRCSSPTVGNAPKKVGAIVFGDRVVDAGRRLSSALILFRTDGKFWPLDRVIQILRPFQLSMTVIIASW